MRYKAMFATGLVVGFIAGTRAGRERYDQLVRLTRQAAEHPAVQKTTQAATAKATDLTRTASGKIPDLARTATGKATDFTKTATNRATGLTKTATGKATGITKTAVPKITGTAKHAAGRLPFTGKSDGGEASGEATNGTDPQASSQADGSPASYNGMRAD
ncbi:MAG: hypothetical protein J2P25_06670 [Nocardiopsaceae bacterium]|nr:hypothetical protein [Nocardiopsaceae bacterium]